MSLQHELGLSKPFSHREHEAVLNVVFTGSLLVKEGNRLLQPFGITDVQFNVLMLLHEQSAEGRINQTTLGNMLLVNRSNITGLIDRMEEAGFVRRIANPGDRRVNYVEMTEAGRKLVKRVHDTYYSRIREIMSDLSKAECNLLCRIMERIRDHLKIT